MMMTLPVNQLLGTSSDSQEFTDFICSLEKLQRSVTNKPTVQLTLDEKKFSKCHYMNIRAFGLSFCFDFCDPAGDKLAAVHVFGNGTDGYSTCNLSLPNDLSLDQRARDIVQRLGEPQVKAGGGFVPVSIAYHNCQPKIEVEFKSVEPNCTTFRMTVDKIADIAATIADRSAPIEKRVRCLFEARHQGGIMAVQALQGAIGDDSVLLVHEAAYLLGQLGDPLSIPCLIKLLEDLTQDCMVRHEAAEALAAIGSEDCIAVVRRYLQDSSIPVRETCHLALKSLENKQLAKQEDRKISKDDATPPLTQVIDPIAQKCKAFESLTVSELSAILLNDTLDLYERYEALFTLRDMGSMEADLALVRALAEKSASALLKHEVAFVLGQLRTPQAARALIDCLVDPSEHPMARHEAALALGSIAPNTKVELQQDIIKTLSQDHERVVAESCLVGLDNIRMEINLPEFCN